MIISAYEDMADAYNMLNKPDSQIILSQMAAQKYLDYGDKEGAAMALGSVIDKYVARKDWTKAKRSMDTYDRESGVFLPNGDIEPGREIYYFQKGQYYMGSPDWTLPAIISGSSRPNQIPVSTKDLPRRKVSITSIKK